MLTWKRLAALAALLAGGVLWLVGSPSPQERLASLAPELERRLDSGEVQIDPAELLELADNTSQSLRVLDLRDENEYNLFHIVDAQRVELDQLRQASFVAGLPRDSVVVLVSNGEGRAREGWKLLAAQRLPRLYLLAGGIHGWLQAFGPPGLLRPVDPACPFDDCRRYRFEAALGGRHPESHPGPKALAGRTYKHKVPVQGPQKRKAGSCG